MNAIHAKTHAPAGAPSPATPPELLAPAGSKEALLAAVAAGADAVYCGVAGSLNARRKAQNIAPDELGPLVSLAHAHGTRVYVAANVAVEDDELPDALELARDVRGAGADAIICQDWGLMSLVRAHVPDLELHVSTQANVHDARGVRLAGELGASRVTLSRELSVSQIARIHAEVPDVELEVFAHGSLCVCYSGLCTLSTFLRDGRSPNRGVCAQPCRLPFDLVDDEGAKLQGARDERPLCMADVCAIDLVSGLAQAGVASLKIEGRMKPAPYVHAVTRAWRGELDALGSGRGDGGAGRRREDLRRSFNRGFTDVYLRGRAHEVPGPAVMSYERSTNRGRAVGATVGFEPEPGFVPRDGQHMRGEVLVRLDAAVGAGDSIELRPVDDPARFLVLGAPADARPGETLRIRCPRPIPAGTPARLTRSQGLVDAAQAAVRAMGRELAQLPRRPMAAAGATGVPLPAAPVPAPASGARPAPLLCALAASLADARLLADAGAHRVYLDVSSVTETGDDLRRLADEVLAQGIVPTLDEVCHDADHARLDPWAQPGSPVLVRNVSELALARERGASPEVGGCVPVHNVWAARTLAGLGARTVWLSPELPAARLAALAGAIPVPAGVLAFGRPRLATCERCVLQVAGPCDHRCSACDLRRRDLRLRNIDARELPVRTDARGRSRIYLDAPLDLTAQAGGLACAGVSLFMVDATALPLDQARAALKRLACALRRDERP